MATREEIERARQLAAILGLPRTEGQATGSSPVAGLALPNTVTPTLPIVPAQQNDGFMQVLNNLINQAIGTANPNINRIAQGPGRKLPDTVGVERPVLSRPSNIDAGTAIREGGLSSGAPLQLGSSPDFLQPPGLPAPQLAPASPASPAAPAGPDLSLFQDAFNTLQAEATAFAAKDFTPDFSAVFASLEQARPGEAKGLSGLEKLSLLLGGAARGAGGVSPTPGSFGRAFAGAGAGAVQGAVTARREDKGEQNRVDELSRRVQLAEAAAQQTLATAEASGDRQQALAALNAGRLQFQGLLDLHKVRTNTQKLDRNAILDALREKDLMQRVELGSLNLLAKTESTKELLLSKQLGINAELVQKHGLPFGLAAAILDGSAGLAGIRATTVANARRDFIAQVDPGGLEADASQEDIDERSKQLIRATPALQKQLDEIAHVKLTELLTDASFLDRVIDQMRGITTPQVQSEIAATPIEDKLGGLETVFLANPELQSTSTPVPSRAEADLFPAALF